MIEYALINKDQCEVIGDPDRILFSIVDIEMVEINGLNSFSTYMAFAIPKNGYGRGEETFEVGNTTEAGNCTTIYLKITLFIFLQNFYKLRITYLVTPMMYRGQHKVLHQQ